MKSLIKVCEERDLLLVLFPVCRLSGGCFCLVCCFVLAFFKALKENLIHKIN